MVSPSSASVPAPPVRNRSPSKTSSQHSIGRLSQFRFLPADTVANLIRRSPDPEDSSWLQLVLHLTGAEAVFLLERSPSAGEFLVAAAAMLARPADEERVVEVVRRLAVRAHGANKPVWRKFTTSERSRLGVAVPIERDGSEEGGASFCLALVTAPAADGEAAAMAAVLQAATVWPFYGELRERHASEKRIFGRASAFLELQARCAGSLDFEGAAAQLADHLREIVDCDVFAVFLRKRGGRVRLAALAGAEADAKGENVLAMEAAARRSLRTGESQVMEDIRVGGDAFLCGPLHLLAEGFEARGWMLAPLREESGRVVGAWLALWRTPAQAFGEKRRFLEAAAPQAASLLRLLRKAKPSGVRANVLRLWERATLSARRCAILGGALLLAAALFPVRDRVNAPCEVQPQVRRVVTAPFQSSLSRAHVKTGETVHLGQALAELDGRELRYELSEVTAQRSRALKRADQALSAGDVAKAQMAELEAEGFRQRQLLLEERIDSLTIRAPLEGMVLRGELERAEGAPVEMGDPLFELAPSGRMIVELAVPESEVIRVAVGRPVEFKVDAFSGRTFRAEIYRVAPRSETVNGDNVFICEAELAEPGELRPGMQGNGRVLGGRRPAMAVLLRPAVEWLRLRFLW